MNTIIENNELLEKLLNRRSIRSFDNSVKMSKDEIDVIVKSFKNSPTWINGQSVSIIILTDDDIKAKLSKICGSQSHIDDCSAFVMFVGDYYKMTKVLDFDGKSIDKNEDSDLTMLNIAMHDSGIALANVSSAMNAIGFGTVPVGSVRGSMEKVTSLLNIPDMSFPVIGLSIGKVNNTSKVEKPPRFPEKFDVFYDKYNEDSFDENDVKDFNGHYKEKKGFTFTSSLVKHWNDKDNNSKDNIDYFRSIKVVK